jgi:hypothetical protein
MARHEQSQVDAGGEGPRGEPVGADVDDRQDADQPGADGPDGPGGKPEAAPASDGADTVATPSAGPSWYRLQSERFFAVADQIHLGALATGVGFIVLGVLLLGGTQVAWRGLLDAVLAVMGLVLVVGSRRSDSRRALLVVGLLLAVVLLGVWRADVPLRGGMRWHTVSPTTPADLTSPYHQTTGSLTIDLRHYPRPPTLTPPPPLVASIGVGRLVVILPPLTTLQGTIAVGEGRASVIGVDKNGVGLEVPLAAANVPALARADLRVGVGTVEVQVGSSP